MPLSTTPLRLQVQRCPAHALAPLLHEAQVLSPCPRESAAFSHTALPRYGAPSGRSSSSSSLTPVSRDRQDSAALPSGDAPGRSTARSCHGRSDRRLRAGSGAERRSGRNARERPHFFDLRMDSNIRGLAMTMESPYHRTGAVYSCRGRNRRERQGNGSRRGNGPRLSGGGQERTPTAAGRGHEPVAGT